MCKLLLSRRGFESEDPPAALPEPEMPDDATDQPQGRARHGGRVGQGHSLAGDVYTTLEYMALCIITNRYITHVVVKQIGMAVK